jgi:hypothetical protein
MNLTLDKKKITPSDYGIIVRNIPKDWTKKDLKEEIEKHFFQSEDKVVYINYCYKIDDIFKWYEK